MGRIRELTAEAGAEVVVLEVTRKGCGVLGARLWRVRRGTGQVTNFLKSPIYSQRTRQPPLEEMLDNRVKWVVLASTAGEKLHLKTTKLCSERGVCKGTFVG